MTGRRGTMSIGSCVALIAATLAGCTQQVVDGLATASAGKDTGKLAYSSKERECMERVMFFESNRSSRDGLVAVGTVVMNRVASDAYPDTICGVVGQKGQFAPGVLSRAMKSKALPDVQSAAAAVLKGERHPGVQKSMFFHTAGLKFPYRNMHYVLVAGGNAFYERRNRSQVTQPVPPPPVERSASIATKAALSYDAGRQAADPIGAMILEQSARKPD